MLALDRKCLIVAVAALTALLGAASTFAQVRTSLQVRVTDRTAVPVPSARVALLFDDGRVVELETDPDGLVLAEVTGRFGLEVSRPGFRTVETNAITLAPGETYQLDFVLLAGDPADVERVELLIDDAAGFGGAGGPSDLESLPRSDRLFGLRGGINVSGIAEGASQQWIAASGSVFASSANAGFLVPLPEPSAQFAASVGVDDSLPPGGPRFHGEAYYFHRNDALNARNFFDPPNEPIPPFKYHFFGGDTGGPLSDETFLMTRYWGLRMRQSITRAATVPDPARLAGNFSSLQQPILDPETGFPFENNIIPADRLHPMGVALARRYPEPNVDGAQVQNFLAVGRLETVADAFGIRVDHRMTISDETSFEYQYSRDTTEDPFNLVTGITNVPGFGARDALDTHTVRIGNTHVFSPLLVHQFGFSFGELAQPREILSDTETPVVIISGFSNLGHASTLPQRRRNRTFELDTGIVWSRPDQTTYMGGSFRHFDFDAFMDLYSRGQFQFNGASYANNALANLLLGLPANALRLEGDTGRRFHTWMSGIYLQHEWRPRPTLQLTAGLRYDYQTPFEEADGRVANITAGGTLEVSPDRLYSPDRNNWGPRLGLAWSPMADTVLRASYAIYYDSLAVGDSLFLLGLNPPFVQFDVENNDPVVPRFDLGTVFEDPASTTPPSVFSAAGRTANPYLQHWSILAGRSFGSAYDVTASYVGQKGAHLRRQVNRNQPLPGPAATLEDRRPIRDFGNVFQFETTASSNAHAMNLGLVRRMSRGIGFRLDYRLARIIDDATLISILPQNSHDLGSERGLSDLHVKHRFTLSGRYNLPYLGGWQLQVTGLFQSGTPLSAILGTDLSGTGSPIVNRPDLVADTRVDDPTTSRFFNTDAFSVPDFGRFGTSGRNVIIGPGLANVDVSIAKVFSVSDRLRAQFRIDFYNVSNHPNFIAPPTTQNFADAPDFGALFVARSPRVIQLGLRVLW